MQCACVTLAEKFRGGLKSVLHIPMWPLDQSEFSVLSVWPRGGGEAFL